MLQSSFSNQVEVQISKRPRLMKDQTQQHAVPYEDPCAADNERGAAEHDDKEVAGQGEEDEDEEEEEDEEEDEDKDEDESEDKDDDEKEGASEHDEELPECFSQVYEIRLALATSTGRFEMPTLTSTQCGRNWLLRTSAHSPLSTTARCKLCTRCSSNSQRYQSTRRAQPKRDGRAARSVVHHPVLATKSPRVRRCSHQAARQKDLALQQVAAPLEANALDTIGARVAATS